MDTKIQNSKISFNKNRIFLFIISIVIAWFIIAFLILPNVNILFNSFLVDGRLSMEPFHKILSSKRAMNSIKNSFLLAITLPITVNIVGIFLVLITEYFDVKGSSVLRIGYSSTLIFAGVMLASGYLFIYGSNGMLTKAIAQIFPHMNMEWFIGYPAVMFVMTFACTSNHIMFLKNAIRGIDYQTVEAARNMGASQFYILRKTVFPSLKPVLITLTILIFQAGLGAMSSPLMVGGENFQTISPIILTFAQRPESRDLAALLSIFLGLAQLILVYALTKNEKNGNYMSISKVKTKIQKQKINNKTLNVVIHVLAYILLAIYTLPLIMVVIFSFTDTYSIATSTLSLNRFTLANYIRILTDESAYKPFITSVFYAAIASVLVTASMVYIARLIHKYNNKLTMILEYLLHIPWLLPGLMLALGLVMTYDKPNIIMGNRVLTGTIWIMLIAYVIVEIPFTLRVIKSAYYSLDNNLEDAARNLGAKGFYIFARIILPVILPTALAVLALAFNGKLADYDLSVFLYHPLLKPLGIVIRSNADPDASVDAMAINFVYTVILMVISTLVLYFVYGKGSNYFSKKKENKLTLENMNRRIKKWLDWKSIKQ